MESTYSALKRLGVVAVGATTLLATPYLGVTVASAAHTSKVEFFSPFRDDANADNVGTTPLDETDAGDASANVATISSQTDGTDTTVRLLTDAPAEVVTVEYSYRPTASADVEGSYVAIATVTARPFVANFNTLPIANGTAITLRAVAKRADGGIVSIDQENVTVDNNAASVNVTSPNNTGPGAQPSLGKFNNQVIVSGTVSPGYAGTVRLADITGGVTPAGGPAITAATVTPTVADGKFSALVPTNQTPVRSTVYINAATTAGAITDETEIATTYDQLVTTITSSPATVNDRPTSDGGTTTNIVITVADQNGAPVGDALTELDLNRDGDSADAGESNQRTNTSGQVTYSIPAQAANGTRQFDVIANQTNAAGFNSADGDKRITITQNSVTQVPTTLTISSLDVTPTAIPPGTASARVLDYPTGETSFAIDEEDPEVFLFLKDQAGNAFKPGQPISYRVTFDPEGTNVVAGVDTLGPRRIDGAAANAYASGNTSDNGAGTADDGAFQLPDTLIGNDAITGAPTNEGTYLVEAFVNRDSDAAPTAGDVNAAPVTYTFDGASMAFDNGILTQSEAGTGSTTRTGTYVLDNGTVLDGRVVDLTLGGGSGFAVQTQGGVIFATTQPAGTTRVSDRVAVSVTGTDGKFSVNLTDPVTLDNDDDPTTPAPAGANQQQQETIVLTADARTSPDTASQTVEFIRNASPAEIRVAGYQTLLDGAVTPGRPVTVTLSVDNVNNGTNPDAGGDKRLSGLPVALSVDKGYFTSRNGGSRSDNGVTNATQLQPATIPTGPALAGAYRRDADGKTLTTSDAADSLQAGQVRFTVAIDRDADFDDDGNATVTVTATVGGITRTIPIIFSTNENAANTVPVTAGAAAVTFFGEEPLNASPTEALKIVPNTATVVTNASSNVGEQGYEVEARDQFGNLAKVDFAVSANNGDVDNNSGETSYTSETGNDFDADSALPTLTNTGPEQTATQVITVSHSFNTYTYVDADGGTAGFQASTGNPPVYSTSKTTNTDPRTATQTVTYYAPIASSLTYVFSKTPNQDSVPANTGVTVSAEVKDQRGNPVQNLQVQFLRSGPNDSAGNAQGGGTTQFTNAAGKAGFSFSSAAPGLATVTAIVTDGSGNELSRGVVNITFTSGTPPTSSPTPTPTATTPAGPVSIDGPGVRRQAYGTVVTLTGKAPAGSTVQIFFRKRNTTAFLQLRNLAVGSDGTWRTTYNGLEDYRIFAKSGANQTAAILIQASPTLNAPAFTTVTKNSIVTLRGKAVPGTAVVIAFRKSTDAPGTYPTKRTVTANSAANWSRAFVASQDYRIYVVRDARDPITRTSVFDVPNSR